MNDLLTNHPKAHAWLTEFHEEHLEEASFLCEQRLSSLDDPELIWQDLRDGEKRQRPISRPSSLVKTWHWKSADNMPRKVMPVS